VTLTWSAPGSGDAVTSYIIEAGSAPGLANLANFSTGNTLTMFQASGVGGGTYYVRIRAASGSGTSAASNEAILVVGGSAGVAPGAPTGLRNTVNAGGTVSFVWNAASGSPTTYVIEAGSQSGLANLANSDLGGPATSMTATGVGPGTYYVRVRAKNAHGISSPSNEIVVTVDGGAPIITVNAYPIAGGATDSSSHGIAISIDGQQVTTMYTSPGFVAPHPSYVGPLVPGTHVAVISMVNWDSLLINVGSDAAGNSGGVESTSFVLLSSLWSRTPLSTRAACSGRVLFSGRATGSITFSFNVVQGRAASACPPISR
jgi:hypothetical protein